MELHANVDELNERGCTNISHVLCDVILLLLYNLITRVCRSILFCCYVAMLVASVILRADILGQVRNSSRALSCSDLLSAP